MLYRWARREEPLGASWFVARGLVISSLDHEDNGIVARGTITTMDYVENFGGTDGWVAEGHLCSHGIMEWNVKPNEEDGFHWRDGNGYPIFTISASLNVAMNNFISGCLNDYLEYLSKHIEDGSASGVVVTDTVVTYSGPMFQYEGPCVCATTQESEFPWEKLTNGGQFPENCFKCSCGNMWWRAETVEGWRWIPVLDPEAWKLLLQDNGVLNQPFGTIRGGVELVATLRAAGFIPVG